MLGGMHVGGFTNIYLLVAIAEVCSASRERKRREGYNADGCKITEEHKDPVSFRILLPDATVLHVASHEDVRAERSFWMQYCRMPPKLTTTDFEGKAHEPNPDPRIGK